MTRKIKLTPPELLFTARKRAGHNQRKAADAHGVSVNRYSRWELGTEPLDVRERSIRVKPTPVELAVVLRRRAGLTQRQLAKRLGVCRFWLMRLETGGADPSPLLKHWRLGA